MLPCAACSIQATASQHVVGTGVLVAVLTRCFRPCSKFWRRMLRLDHQHLLGGAAAGEAGEVGDRCAAASDASPPAVAALSPAAALASPMSRDSASRNASRAASYCSSELCASPCTQFVRWSCIGLHMLHDAQRHVPLGCLAQTAGHCRTLALAPFGGGRLGSVR